MSERRSRAILVLVVVTPVLIACTFLTAVMLAGGSAGATLATGRSVFAHSDSLSLSSRFSSDTATIETAGRTIVVKPTRLMVDGTTVATINENVSNVEIRIKRGVITFLADGQPVHSALR